MESHVYPRADWPHLLCALAAEKVEKLAQSLEINYCVEDIQVPQSGLGLLQLRDSALADCYYLGEIPISRALVRIQTHDGHIAEGGVQIMDDRAHLARSIAILDAVMAEQLPGFENICTLLQEGNSILDKQNQQRRALLSSSKVDFSLLGNADESEDDD